MSSAACHSLAKPTRHRRLLLLQLALRDLRRRLQLNDLHAVFPETRLVGRYRLVETLQLHVRSHLLLIDPRLQRRTHLLRSLDLIAPRSNLVLDALHLASLVFAASDSASASKPSDRRASLALLHVLTMPRRFLLRFLNLLQRLLQIRLLRAKRVLYVSKHVVKPTLARLRLLEPLQVALEQHLLLLTLRQQRIPLLPDPRLLLLPLRAKRLQLCFRGRDLSFRRRSIPTSLTHERI